MGITIMDIRIVTKATPKGRKPINFNHGPHRSHSRWRSRYSRRLDCIPMCGLLESIQGSLSTKSDAIQVHGYGPTACLIRGARDSST